MVFEDNFVEPIPGWMIDPVLKVRLGTSGHKEAYAFDEADLIIDYDPEIRPDRLTKPPSDETRARRLANPSLVHLADQQGIFSSASTKRLTNISFKWDKPEDELRLKVVIDFEFFNLKQKSLVKEKYPQISKNPTSFMLYIIRSLAKMHEIRGKDLQKTYPQMKRIEVCVMTDVARDFFRLPPDELNEIEPGWVCIASREAGQ